MPSSFFHLIGNCNDPYQKKDTQHTTCENHSQKSVFSEQKKRTSQASMIYWCVTSFMTMDRRSENLLNEYSFLSSTFFLASKLVFTHFQVYFNVAFWESFSSHLNSLNSLISVLNEAFVPQLWNQKVPSFLLITLSLCEALINSAIKFQL